MWRGAFSNRASPTIRLPAVSNVSVQRWEFSSAPRNGLSPRCARATRWWCSSCSSSFRSLLWPSATIPFSLVCVKGEKVVLIFCRLLRTFHNYLSCRTETKLKKLTERSQLLESAAGNQSPSSKTVSIWDRKLPFPWLLCLSLTLEHWPKERSQGQNPDTACNFYHGRK